MKKAYFKFYLPTLVLLLLLFSDFFTRRFIFFSGLEIKMDIFWLGFICTLLFFRKRKIETFQLAGFLILLQSLIALCFFKESKGQLLFSDDHPSFLYRLILLKEHFPKIPFYDVNWNAGYSAREFFASGMLNVFFVNLPLVYLFDLSTYDSANIYNFIIIWSYIFVVPWSVFFAARLLGFGYFAAFCSAVLALGPSSGQFEWLLKYGTLGFCFASGLLPLAMVSAYRVAFEEIKWRDVLLLLLVSFLVLSWSLSFLAFLPLVFLALCNFKTIFAPERRFKILMFIILFLLINIPWVLTFIAESKVASFVSSSALPGAAQHANFNFTLAITEFKSLVLKVNPMLLLFFVPGLFCLELKRKRHLYFFSILFLLAIAFVGEQFKPQLELKRLIIPASYLMCLFAGLAIARALKYFQENNRTLGLCSFAIVSGYLFLSPLNVAAIYSNRSDERFKFADSSIRQLIDGISRYADENRVFFAGFILQELGASSYAAQDGGHIAPLAAFSAKSMYASHYYHKYWTAVDPIPTSYRKRGEQGIEEFLDLINASSIITHSHEWAKYCSTKSRYLQLFQVGRFRFFKRSSEKLGYFIEGLGEIEKAQEGIFVKPYSEEVVIKFRFLPKLKVFGGGELSAVPVFIEELGGAKTEQVSYIKLKVSKEILAKKQWLKIGYYPEKF